MRFRINLVPPGSSGTKKSTSDNNHDNLGKSTEKLKSTISSKPRTNLVRKESQYHTNTGNSRGYSGHLQRENKVLYGRRIQLRSIPRKRNNSTKKSQKYKSKGKRRSRMKSRSSTRLEQKGFGVKPIPKRRLGNNSKYQRKRRNYKGRGAASKEPIKVSRHQKKKKN